MNKDEFVSELRALFKKAQGGVDTRDVVIVLSSIIGSAIGSHVAAQGDEWGEGGLEVAKNNMRAAYEHNKKLVANLN